MATLPERLRRLEEVVLGSAATGALLSRVGQLEVCCLGSEAAGHLPQRLSKLEEVTGCAAGAGNDVEVAPQAVPLAVEEVPNAAASSQAGKSFVESSSPNKQLCAIVWAKGGRG